MPSSCSASPARSALTNDDLVARATASVTEHGGLDPVAFPKLAALLRHVSGDYSDPATFGRLREALGAARRPLYYLAIPPSAFPAIIEQLAAFAIPGARLVVEKPFGRDLASARELNALIRRAFPEEAIFRIDHYSARKRSRISCTSGSRTRSSSRSVAEDRDRLMSKRTDCAPVSPGRRLCALARSRSCAVAAITSR